MSFHMAEQGILGQPKRKRQGQEQQSLSERPQHQSKKQKFSHPTRPPPLFWDNLSEIPLTENALYELNRRNHERARSARSLSRKKARRPVTRRAAAELLARRAPISLKHIERFARQGGPDLSDLRGVSKDAGIFFKLNKTNMYSATNQHSDTR